LSDVTGISLSGVAQSIIFDLAIRRLSADFPDWQSCSGPKAGDFEIRLESSYGLEGSIFARDLVFSLTPEEKPPSDAR
jgi:hypothetical protein